MNQLIRVVVVDDSALMRRVISGMLEQDPAIRVVGVARNGREAIDLVKALRQSTQSTSNRAGQRLVERQLNVQPTVTVRPGWPLRVIVHKDLVLRPYRLPSPP